MTPEHSATNEEKLSLRSARVAWGAATGIWHPCLAIPVVVFHFEAVQKLMLMAASIEPGVWTLPLP